MLLHRRTQRDAGRLEYTSDSTILALRHGIKRCGIPKAVYFDNGTEFLTYDIAGRGHRRRKSQEGKFVPPPIFKRLGIEMRNALVRNAKAKPIERTFRDVKEHISKLFTTYCGGNILERPESLKRILKKGEIPLDSDVRKMIDALLDGYMSNQPYGGSVQRDKNLSKSAVFKKYLPETLRFALDGELDLMLMRSTRPQKIGRNGAYLTLYGMKLEYGMEELSFHQGKQVYLRYDPSDLSTVRVYSAPDDTYLLTAAMNADTRIKFDDEQEAVKIAQAKVGRVAKETKKALKEMKNAVPEHRRIDALDLKLRKAYENKSGELDLKSAKMIEAVMANEQTDDVEIMKFSSVIIDIAAMNQNIQSRR